MDKDNKIIKLVHQNSQGLLGKQLQLELFMSCEHVDILCITEHWLREEQLMFSFNNHIVGSYYCRRNAIRGGSLIIINKNIKFKERVDIVSLSVEQTAEISCIELEQLIIVSVYRPPSSSYDTFENVFEELLNKLSKSCKRLLICGDFNINLLENNVMATKLKSLFLSYNLVHLFAEATRITSTSKTCIDNIFTDIVPTSKHIINNLDSDHCGQLVTFQSRLQTTSNKMLATIPVTKARLEKFKCTLLNKINCIPAVNNDANTLYNSFFDMFCKEFKSTFTSKLVSANRKSTFKDWATTGIHRSRKKLYDLYHEKSYNHSQTFLEYVRQYSKLFKKVCLSAKSMYLRDIIKNSKNQIKTTWSVISRETGKDRHLNTDYSLNFDDKIINNDIEVARAFENYFTDIPVSTTKNLNSSLATATQILNSSVTRCETSFEFQHVNSMDIVKVFKLINIKNSCDLWGISTRILNYVIPVIAPQLALIFNTCVSSGIFPDKMKLSKIIPLFKSGSTDDPSNFRPISVLPTISKIFEKLILHQLQNYFTSYNILHKKQFGFTRGRSTTDAGVELLNNIFEAWEDSQDALGVFCDLSKAFDCVHHDILIGKLSHYGINGIALDLFRSYLGNRVQCVDINGTRSPGSVVTMGVPQGSILGPFLFLIYINDLPYFLRDNCEVVLFADDTSLIFKVKRHQTIFDDVNNTLSKLINWFSVNNLLLNSQKTKCVRFLTPNVKKVNANVVMNGHDLSLVETTKFLGITLDSKLQWGPHISMLAKKLSAAAYAVYKIRQLTDVDTARLVYFAYFHSLMCYGILLWGGAADINTIFVLQKRAIRSIYSLNSKCSLREKFKEINIMTVASQYIFANLMFVHKNKENFCKISDTHSLNTRNKNNLVSFKSRLHKISNSFKGLCIRCYNKVPIPIKELDMNSFKITIKKHLCNKAYYKVSDYLEDSIAWE